MPKFQAARNEETFVDDGGVTNHYYVWKSGTPKGVVQIVHGLGEYATRYEPLAQALVKAGFAVYAGDYRGHGATGVQQHGGDLTKLGRLGPGGVRAVIRGIRQLRDIAHAEHAGVPMVLIGHSMGSMLGQRMINEHPDAYDAVVFTGTAYRTLRHANSGDLSKRHREPGGTGHEWLSRDPAVAAAFHEDPLTFDAKTAQLFGIVDGLRLLGKPRRLGRDIPILIMIGSEDPVGGPRSVELLAKAYRKRAGLSDVTVKIYPGARHEVFNETNSDEVVADLVTWLDEHAKPAT
jgi:alpha-beta hydrolase superfamily lysophospholipase